MRINFQQVKYSSSFIIYDKMEISDNSLLFCSLGDINMGKKIVVVNAGPRKGWNTVFRDCI